MKTNLHHLLLALILLTGIGARSQQSILSAGNDASSGQGMVTWSVGQTVYVAEQGSSGTITTGVQQPYEILFMEGMDDIGISLKCVVFPNPAEDYVILKNEGTVVPGLRCRLTGLTGDLIRETAITEKETKIGLEDLAPGTFLLSVTGDEKLLQTYKIIKK